MHLMVISMALLKEPLVTSGARAGYDGKLPGPRRESRVKPAVAKICNTKPDGLVLQDAGLWLDQRFLDPEQTKTYSQL